MAFGSRIATAARHAAGRLAGALGAYAAAPIVPGVGRTYGGAAGLQRNEQAQRIVDGREALYGRVSTALGPIPSSITTNPGQNLTPARIAAIHQQVLVAGWMLDKACLDESVLLHDAHTRAVDYSGRVAVTGSPFDIEPADSSDLARQVADYQMAVIGGISGWDRACSRLLFGNAAGYALEEAVYADRRVRFKLGKGHAFVEAPTPVAFEWVSNKHTRWNLACGDALELDTGSGGFILPPDHKFITYEAAGDFQVRRRGYLYPAIWLYLLKSNAIARWAVLLDIWGIRQPFGYASLALWQDEKRRAQMLEQLRNFGRGAAALFTDDFKIEASAGIADGDARGMHAALLGIINAELSKLIQGQLLTTETGGAGSYALSATHQDTKAEWVAAWERNLSACVREWMRAALRLACYELDARGGIVGVLPGGLAAVLGADPEEIIALCGRPYWRTSREMTPAARMKLYDDAVNRLGLSVDEDAPYREFGICRARDPEKQLRGAPVVLAADAAATSSAEAVDGVDNPKPQQPAAHRRRSARGTPARTANGRFAKRAA